MPEGDALNFVYRVCVHGGDDKDAKITDRYFDFAYPPKVTVVEDE